jgi:hypothetical protein
MLIPRRLSLRVPGDPDGDPTNSATNRFRSYTSLGRSQLCSCSHPDTSTQIDHANRWVGETHTAKAAKVGSEQAGHSDFSALAACPHPADGASARSPATHSASGRWGCPGAAANSVCAIQIPSYLSRSWRVPIAIRRFYKQNLWILQ